MWNLAKFILGSVFLAMLVVFVVFVAVINIVGEPPMAIRIVLTLVSVLPVGFFICLWLWRRLGHGKVPPIAIPASILSAWKTFDEIVLFLNDLTSFGFSRRVILAAGGSTLWSTLALVPLPIGFVVLMTILFMAFPVSADRMS